MDTIMEYNAYHEKIYKSFQEIRTYQPTIMVLTTPENMHVMHLFAKSCGFNVVFPPLNSDLIKHHKKLVQGCVIDINALLIEKNIKILDSLDKDFLGKKTVINIPTEVLLFGKEYLTFLKAVSKYQIPLYVSGLNIPLDQIDKILSRASHSMFGLKRKKKPLMLGLSPTVDRTYIAEQHYDILGLEDGFHSMNCHSIMYAILASALLASNQPIDLCAIGSSVALRAASKRAASVTNGPGSFFPVFMDAVYHMKRDYIYQIQFISDEKNAKSLEVA